ncbi:MFS transporter [Pseudoalteromonas porphyrae]|uniref:MFS transporter n=1 Tax=Pseudoalteromonas porphyrae TaxID=187330 RepID=UPI0006BAED63|nr:MFS transporter [Pseudoalteromonas porphyrae]KPH94156.1 MFS transporter [Pseudoalteromonas porphyrae]
MKKNYLIVLMVLSTFFVISFITNLLAPIFPALIQSYDIGLTLAGFFSFAFFIAYGVMSIPAGLLVQSLGEKKVMLIAFSLALFGSVLFVSMPVFAVAMLALFLIGTAMALLQVAINPLLRASGGSKHFAVFSVAAQLMFGGAATLSPLVYSALVKADAHAQGQNWLLQLVPADMTWLSMYVLFALLCVVMLVVISVVPMKKKAQAQSSQQNSIRQSLQLFKDPTVIKFFFAIVAYVALEQGVANSISVFLQTYHQLDPNTQGAQVVSQFWLSLTLGCLLGIILLKLFDAKHVLLAFSVGAVISLLTALFAGTSLVLWAFPAVGFFLSIMWSVIFSLALNSVAKGHGTVSGILCTGIVGGAFASPIVGAMSELTGSLQLSLLLLLIPLGYILSVGIWAKPLIANHTFKHNSQTATLAESN